MRGNPGWLGLVMVGSLVIALTDAASIGSTDAKVTDRCDSDIYCQGPLLHTVQLAEIFNDSKTFVDLSQVNSPDVTIANFKKLMRDTNGKPSRREVGEYVANNFVMEDELDNTTLSDWTAEPSNLKRIENPTYQNWARELNMIWRTLARKMKDDVAKYPDRHTLIYVQNPFIVPGGRFREFYYWDSYWILKGLLLCDMHQTVKGMVQNFAQMVDTYGFIPNGGRIYYLMRSQPPMFIPMVTLYMEKTKDLEFLRTMMPIMEKEFDYWQTQKMVSVNKNGKTYKMAHYVVTSPRPRPESYREDYLMAQQLPEAQRASFYNDVKAAAESGWDFSNRWCIESTRTGTLSLLNISTSAIIPVELNALLQLNARQLSDAHATLGNTAKALNYKKLATEMQTAIDEVLWNEEEGTWCDYDNKNNKSVCAFYPSNLAPLFTESYDHSKTKDIALRTVSYLKRNKIDQFMGGIPTSLYHTGEQWDYPNAWPPLQSIIVVGLEKTKVPEAQALGRSLGDIWLSANFEGYQETGKMFEKYSAIVPGEGGGGGEYTVQEGFGWTNGVIFEFLDLYPNIKPGELSSSAYGVSDAHDSIDNYDYARLRRSITQMFEE